MTEQEEYLNKILGIYGQHYYPSVQLKVNNVKNLEGRVYLTHDDSNIISLLPPFENDTTNREKN